MRQETIATITDQILKRNKKDRFIVAIDGVDGAGKSYLAGELLEELKPKLTCPVILASIDGFHNPREKRYAKGKDSPVGFFEDSYNNRNLQKLLLEPFKAGAQHVQVQCFNHRTDSQEDAFTCVASQRACLIIEGIFLHRPELINYWDYSIFIHAEFQATYNRMNKRDGCPTDPRDYANRRYYEGQILYLNCCAPAEKASLVIDNTDFQGAFVSNAEQIAALNQMGWRPFGECAQR